MKATTSLLLSITLAISLAGCKSLNPQTGQVEYDPVKTEQVKAIFKPLVSGTTASILKKHPNYRPAIATIYTNMTLLTVSNALSPTTLRLMVANTIAEYGGSIDPMAVGGISSVVAGFEFFYAGRSRADTAADLYVQHISQTLCDGMLEGLLFYPASKP